MEPEPEIIHITQFHIIPFHNDEIHTTVTSESHNIVQWVSEIERPNNGIVGVDIKYKYHNLKDWVATLQLCVGGRCLVYLLESVDYDFPDVLLDFLKNEEYTFVGWDTNYSLDKLEVEMGLDIPMEITVELMELAKHRFAGNIDMSGYMFVDGAEWNESAEMVLGREVEDIPEEVMQLRWDRQLTAEQVKYASIDAFVAFEMGRILDARGFRHMAI